MSEMEMPRKSRRRETTEVICGCSGTKHDVKSIRGALERERLG